MITALPGLSWWGNVNLGYLSFPRKDFLFTEHFQILPGVYMLLQ